jgi:hypothetical protein
MRAGGNLFSIKAARDTMAFITGKGLCVGAGG